MGDDGREPIILEGLLSDQQREVLRRVTSPNKQIARDLKISIYTVRNTLAMVYAKLGIFGREEKRTRALMMALGCGLLSVNEIVEGDARIEDDYLY